MKKQETPPIGEKEILSHFSRAAGEVQTGRPAYLQAAGGRGAGGGWD